MEWPVWRLVSKQVASLQEIDTHWDIIDVLKANDVLDFIDDVQRQFAEKKQ
jgi:predicted CoA-binding protein